MQYEEVFQNILNGVLDKSHEVYVDEPCGEELEYRGPEDETLELMDEETQKILMHRDVHFGGKFDVMLDYYAKEDAPGVQEDLFIERIQELQALEKKLGKNLAPYVLHGREAERVAHFRSLYRQFQELYEIAPKNSTEHLVAALFLSDGLWEEIVDTLDSSFVLKERELIDILLDDQFQDPLSPGFGLVPQAIARVLGLFKVEGAMSALFATLGCDNFELEEEVIHALRRIGEPAKKFLLQKIKSSPSKDCESALIALQAFVPDEEVKKAAQEFLKKQASLAAHLNEYVKGLTLDN